MPLGSDVSRQRWLSTPRSLLGQARVGRMIVGMNNLVQRVALMIIACVAERRDGMPDVF